MKTATKIFGIGTGVVAAGLIGWQAFAEAPEGQSTRSHSSTMMGWSNGMGMGMGCQNMGASAADPAARLADVKRQLGITEKQDPAWNTYSKAVLGAAASLQAERQSHMEAMQRGTESDHNAAMTRMHEQRQQTLDTINGAAQTLLGSLDERQQAEARQILPRLAPVHLGMVGQAMMNNQ